MKSSALRLDKVRESAARAYGPSYVRLNGQKFNLNTVSFGSWMLDYKSGIGGAPFGHGVEIFGANKLGKSSAVAYPLLGNVQKMYLPWRDTLGVPCLIASEPRLVTPQDQEWARALGLEPNDLHVLYPDNVEEAGLMLRELVFGGPGGKGQVDYIVIDSLGGMGNAAGTKEDGKKKAYGISGETSSMLADIMPRLNKNNIGLMIVNQQRQSGSFNGNTTYDSPGGEALHHHMRMRMHIKPGKARYNAKIDGENIMVGRELICKFIKNNMSQGSEKSASFEFFHIKTEEKGFGIDRAQDVINVGKITGVIKGGTWLEHPLFPETKSGEHKLNGKPAVAEFMRENPKAMEKIRADILEVMVREDKEEGAKIRAQEAKDAEKLVTEIDDE
jgi:recombination protein RecA